MYIIKLHEHANTRVYMHTQLQIKYNSCIRNIGACVGDVWHFACYACIGMYWHTAPAGQSRRPAEVATNFSAPNTLTQGKTGRGQTPTYPVQVTSAMSPGSAPDQPQRDDVPVRNLKCPRARALGSAQQVLARECESVC